jgi:uncharacterized protein YecT (DUF1311 family)
MRNTAIGCAAALTFVLSPGSIFADNGPRQLDTPEYKKCMDEADGVTSEMHGCLADELTRQDKILNDTYKVFMDSMVNDAQKTQLRNAEREWIKRTARKCNAAGKESAGGSAEPFMIDDCYIQETEARTLYLRKLSQSKATE